MKTSKFSSARIGGLPILAMTVFLYIGCKTSANFPLCRKLSDTKPSPVACVGKNLYAVCQQRHITITVLSENAASFRGPVYQMRWLQAHYHFLLCDFDQADGKLGKKDYVSCMGHAKSWIKFIQSATPQYLMLDSTIYCANCLPNQNCN